MGRSKLNCSGELRHDLYFFHPILHRSRVVQGNEECFIGFPSGIKNENLWFLYMIVSIILYAKMEFDCNSEVSTLLTLVRSWLVFIKVNTLCILCPTEILSYHVLFHLPFCFILLLFFF